MDFKLIYEYTRNMNVLYVEDDTQMRESTAELLESYFKKVDTAKDGVLGVERYLEYYEHSDNYYDIVIADINMPKKNGLEMIRQIQILRERQPFIIISAHTETEYLLDAIHLDVASFLVKPIKLENLLEELYKIAKAIVEQVTVEEQYNILENDYIALHKKNKKLLQEIDSLKKELQPTNKKNTLSQEITISEEDVNILHKDDFFIADDLEQMTKIIQAIKVTFSESIQENSHCDTLCKKVGKYLEDYGHALSYYEVFENISQNIIELAQFVLYDSSPKNHEVSEQLKEIFENFSHKLLFWQGQFTATITPEEINDFNNNILSDVAVIVEYWNFHKE